MGRRRRERGLGQRLRERGGRERWGEGRRERG